MKASALVTMLALAGISTAAARQPVSSSGNLQAYPERKMELGLFGQTTLSGNDPQLTIGGIQAKKWLNPHAGIRALGGVAQYDATNAPFYIGQGPNGAVMEKFLRQQLTMGVLGFGLELQRQFYKSVYLFAAMEIKGGYGGGTADTLTRTDYKRPGIYESELFYGSGTPATMWFLDAMPSIGAKLVFSRITAGAEVSGIVSRYTNISMEGAPAQSLSDFSAGSGIIHRIFVGYRF